MMRRGTAIQIYKSMPAAEQQIYRQWARVNVALFTMLAGVLATSLGRPKRAEPAAGGSQQLDPDGVRPPFKVRCGAAGRGHRMLG